MSPQTRVREARAPSGDRKSLQPRIQPLVFIEDKWDGCMDGEGIVSCGAVTPFLGFRFLEDFANPNFEHCSGRVVCRFTPVVTNKRVGHLLVQQIQNYGQMSL